MLKSSNHTISALTLVVIFHGSIAMVAKKKATCLLPSVDREFVSFFYVANTLSNIHTYTPLVFTLRLHNYFFMLFAFLSVPFQIVI
jgi:hypothetical protein